MKSSQAQDTASPLALIPKAESHPLSRVLILVILLSFIPALLLTLQRVTYENSQKTTAMVMDYPALVVQARRYGLEPQQLLDKYKSLGINGVALYEDTVASLEQRGKVYLKNGSDLANDYPNEGVKTNAVYMQAATPELKQSLAKRFTIPTKNVKIGGKEWLEWPTDPSYLPTGPDNELIAKFKSQGLVVVYRPYYDEAVPLEKVGTDWPDVPYIAFTGDEVIGARTPEMLEQVNKSMGKRLPAIIEGNIQKGLEDIVMQHGGVRLFALSPSWQNSLDPEDVASKYNLAARERAQRILYMRPYPTINETELMLRKSTTLITNSKIKITTPVVDFYKPSPLLQILSMFGPIAALILLGLSIVHRKLGVSLAIITLILAFGLNTLKPFESSALVAAVTFPALGLILRRHKSSDWFLATGISLVGVVFVSALGASQNSTLGLEPFRGVGLTLMLPLLLVTASFIPRQDIREIIQSISSRPVKLGDLLILGIGAALLMTIYERRGNSTGGSVSDFEASIRRDVQDNLVRPRFKEVGAHPLGILGLSGELPGYFSALMLLGGVMGQASILNTFSHFHTPFLISASRCFLGLGLGLISGYIVVQAVRYALNFWNSHKTEAGA